MSEHEILQTDAGYADDLPLSADGLGLLWDGFGTEHKAWPGQEVRFYDPLARNVYTLHTVLGVENGKLKISLGVTHTRRARP